LGYKGDYIKDYFLNQRYFADNFTIHTKSGFTQIHRNKNDKEKDDFKITFVDTGLETLPGERILKVKDFIPDSDGDFMVTYGDGLSNINIIELLKFHKTHGKAATITAVQPTGRFGALEIQKELQQKRIGAMKNANFTGGGFGRGMMGGCPMHNAAEQLPDAQAG